jgi:hypothetical protein
VARNLLEATDLLSAGRADATGRGEQAARAARAPSARAAKELMAGIKIAQSLPPFRRAGLRPSV